MELQKTEVTNSFQMNRTKIALCKKCGKKALLWRILDGLGNYQVICNLCGETTEIAHGMLTVIDAWNEGKTYPSQKVEPSTMKFCCDFKNRG